MRIVFTLLFFMFMLLPAQAAGNESAYQRVLRSGTLRCGYLVWQPFFMKDPNTGKFSGLYYEMTEAMGKTLNLKIEWVQEYTLGQQIEALKTGKIDALCGDGPYTRSAMPYLGYSESLFYMPVYLWVARDQKKKYAGKPLEFFNSEKIKLTGMDGDLSSDLAQSHFSKAKLLSIPSTGEPTTLMENVVTGKVQALVQEYLTVHNFNKNRPDVALVTIQGEKPLAVYPNFISVLPEEQELLAMINRGIRFGHDTGRTEQILRKQDPELKTLFLPAPRHQM